MTFECGIRPSLLYETGFDFTADFGLAGGYAFL